MQKHELVNLLAVRGVATREQLQSKYVHDLEQMLDDSNLAQIRAEAARQFSGARNPQVIAAEEQARAAADKLAWTDIFRTAINGQVAKDTEANRNVVRGWLNFDEQVSSEWFKQVLAENPKLAKQLTWQTARVLDPKYREQLDEAQDRQDREVFRTFAKANGFADIDANFYLAKDLFFGRSFHPYELVEAVQSGRLHLTPASPEQLAEYQQEAAEVRADYLRNHATPQELREAVRTEADQRRQALQRQEQERQIAGREKADEAFGFPPLPEFNLETGDRIDAAYLNRLSNVDLTRFKMMMRKYGAAALTRRLNGRG